MHSKHCNNRNNIARINENINCQQIKLHLLYITETYPSNFHCEAQSYNGKKRMHWKFLPREKLGMKKLKAKEIPAV